MIDYQKRNTFFGRGQYHVQGKAIPVQISGSYKLHSFEPVTITVWSDDEGADKAFDSSMRFPYGVWFEGKTEMGESIWIMEIKPHQITGMKRLEADAGLYIAGDYGSIVRPDQTLFIHLKVSPTPIIISEWMYSQSYDGTISRIGNDEKERLGIRWETARGKFQLIDNYEYISETQNNQPITLQIQNNSLFISYVPSVSSDIKSILYQLPQFLDDDFSLLSFIGRQRIVCYEATASIDDNKTKFKAFCRYKSWRGFYNLPSDQSFLRSLIRPKALQEGVFDHLLKAFQSSPYKAIIAKTIPYLITSYEDGYVETHLVQAYAALESMVDGIGETLNQSYLLGNGPFDKLAGKIRELIRAEVNDSDIAQGIIKKLPELRRKSFLDRLLFLLEAQKINTELIWPPETDEAKEFHELLKRRNLLIHTGSVGQGDISLFDLNRVQKLVELWILKLLDCPDDAINEYSLWQGAPINKILHY